MKLFLIILAICLACLVGGDTEKQDNSKEAAPENAASDAEEPKDPQDDAPEEEGETEEVWLSEEEEYPRPVVEAPAGTFRGVVMTSMQSHPFQAFVGIPYAKPPVGDLRFAKPQPYPKIEDDIFEANAVAPVCIQPKDFELGYGASEDCLYLNVYTPLPDDEDNTDKIKLKKVLVYIHGGAYFVGTGNEYVPGDLVATGNVIVVTFNYRLSWLGFLKGDTPELPGNQGLWDQLMALKWVKDNIRAFGGDPKDVTIGSNLLGSESVSALSLSPHGKDLFTKAIVTSGALLTNPSRNGSSDFLLDTIAELVECKSKDAEIKDIEGVVKCLKALPSEAFVLKADLTVRQAFTTIDGDFFPRPIVEMIQNRQHLGNVGFFSRDYLVSMTNNEGLLFFHGVFGNGVDPVDVDAEFLSRLTDLPAPLCQEMLSWYQEKDHSFTKPAYDICADILMVLPQIQFLRVFGSITKAQPPNKLGKQYLLYMNFTPEYIPPPLLGMGHGIDLVYLFDLDPNYILTIYYGTPTNPGMMPEDLAMKKRYMRIVTDFMKTGNPGTTLAYDAKVTWHTFDVKFEEYLSLEPEPVMRDSPFLKRRRFWSQDFIKGARKYVNTSQQPKDEL